MSTQDVRSAIRPSGESRLPLRCTCSFSTQSHPTNEALGNRVETSSKSLAKMEIEVPDNPFHGPTQTPDLTLLKAVVTSLESNKPNN